MATFTKRDKATYQNLCHLSETGILHFMKDLLLPRYKSVVATPAYVYALGDIPVALVAHADTVFRTPPNLTDFFYDQEKDVIWHVDGAGADDRAGIFAILKLVREYNLRPHVIITTGEEIGCVGACKLTTFLKEFPAELKFMIQLDRRGYNDSVYYDCDNPKFETFINSFGFKTAIGSLSDISILAPHFEVAAVNLSVGYEDEHTCVERLHVNWLYETIDKTATILNYVKKNIETVPIYDYIPTKYAWITTANKYFFDDVYPFTTNSTINDTCVLCKTVDKKENMIPIIFDGSVKPYPICLNCLAENSHNIRWCKNCGNGYYMLPFNDEKYEINNWICEACKDNEQ